MSDTLLAVACTLAAFAVAWLLASFVEPRLVDDFPVEE